MESLPKGIYHEVKRSRYRVRLYQGKQIIHCSYHKTLDDALNTYQAIKPTTKALKPSNILNSLWNRIST